MPARTALAQSLGATMPAGKTNDPGVVVFFGAGCREHEAIVARAMPHKAMRKQDRAFIRNRGTSARRPDIGYRRSLPALREAGAIVTFASAVCRGSERNRWWT